MRKILVCACAAALLVVTVFGCGQKAANPPAKGSPGVASGDGFTVTLSVRPTSGKAGGTFVLALKIRNDSGGQRTFEAPSGQTYDFAARDASGREVWRWSNGKAFIQVVTPVSFAAGQTRVYDDIWTTSGQNPGKYTVEGVFMALKNLRPAVEVEITE